jgi:uncharacterized protein
LPIVATAGGVRVAVRLTPRGRADRIDGIGRTADGTSALLVSVTAPPADGRANDALLRLLAKEWDVARRDLTIVFGLKSRNKVVQVAGELSLLMERLAAVLVPQSGR